MQTKTAVRRLTKRANDFLGMTLDQYLKQFTYFSESLNRVVLNDNASMQDCWYSCGMPTSEDEL